MVAKLRIPKKLIQTYHLPDLIPQHIRSNVKIYAYDYERKIFDDQDGLKFIQKNFSANIVRKYQELSGAHKADLLRYCVLHVHGGVYMDIKTILIKDLNQIINHKKETVHHRVVTVDSTFNEKTIYQGFIATTPHNPLFLTLISRLLDVTKDQIKNDYLINTRIMYEELMKVTDVQDVRLLKEVCKKAGETRETLDRYGLHCICYNEDMTEEQFLVRDHTYPWHN